VAEPTKDSSAYQLFHVGSFNLEMR